MRFDNYKQLITVFHSKPRNPYVSHYQNSNPYVGSKTFIVKCDDDWSLVKAFIDEVHAHGYKVQEVVNGIGEIINVSI